MGCAPDEIAAEQSTYAPHPSFLSFVRWCSVDSAYSVAERYDAGASNALDARRQTHDSRSIASFRMTLSYEQPLGLCPLPRFRRLDVDRPLSRARRGGDGRRGRPRAAAVGWRSGADRSGVSVISELRRTLAVVPRRRLGIATPRDRVSELRLRCGDSRRGVWR